MKAVELRNGARQMFASTEQEVILAGPADTGKTISCCIKVHTTCSTIPNVQAAIVRKTAESLAGTVVKTFRRIIAGSKVVVYGGESPQRFIYPNGSQIWLGGLNKPERVLSAERDLIYCNQAEEMTLDDWEILLTRCSGRAAVVEYPQLIGDANPAGSQHWIRKRTSLRLLRSLHTDNPTLYDLAGNLLDTTDARRRMAALDKLTGVRRKRLLEGIWATAEGAVYANFDSQLDGPHVRKRDANEFVKFMLAMDEGFTNPQTNLLIGEDGDGRWHIFREFYVTEHLETQIVAQAKGWWDDVRTAQIGLSSDQPVRCVRCAVDNAAPGLIAALNAAGVRAEGGKGALVDSAYNTARGRISGISKIQDRLAVQADGKARLTVDPSCINTINEFESYVWEPGEDIPQDANNHAIGGLRYLTDVTEQPTGAFGGTHQLVQPAVSGDRLIIDVGRLSFNE